MPPLFRRLPPLLLPLWASIPSPLSAVDSDFDPDFEEENEANQGDMNPGDHPQHLGDHQLRRLHLLADADRDGRVSLAEVLAFVKDSRKVAADREVLGVIGDFDTSGDGLVTLEEHLGNVDAEGNPELERMRQLEEAKFRAADEDGDGKLHVSELRGFLWPETHAGVHEVIVKDVMRRRDMDNDGALSMNELWEPVEGADSAAVEADFAKLDADHDGKINLEELKVWESDVFQDREAFRKLFLAADKDGDMHLSADELEGHRELMEDHPRTVLLDMAMHHEL